MSEFKGTKTEWYAIQFGSMFLIQDDNFYEARNIFDIEDVGEEKAKANIQLAKHAPEMLEMLKDLVRLNDLGHQVGQFDKANELIQKATTI